MSDYVQICIRATDQRVLDCGMLEAGPYPREEGERVIRDLNDLLARTKGAHMEAYARHLTAAQAKPTANDLYEAIMPGHRPAIQSVEPVAVAAA